MTLADSSSSVTCKDLEKLSRSSYDSEPCSDDGFSESDDSDSYPSASNRSKRSQSQASRKKVPGDLSKKKSRMSRVSRKSKNPKGLRDDGAKEKTSLRKVQSRSSKRSNRRHTTANESNVKGAIDLLGTMKKEVSHLKAPISPRQNRRTETDRLEDTADSKHLLAVSHPERDQPIQPVVKSSVKDIFFDVPRLSDRD